MLMLRIMGVAALAACCDGTAVVQLDKEDHKGLDVLRDAQPPSVRAGCAALQVRLSLQAVP